MTDFEKIIEWLNNYILKIVLVVIAIIVALLIVLLLKLILAKMSKNFNDRSKKIAKLIYSIIKLTILVLTLFIILAICDFDTTIGLVLFSIFVFVIGISAIPQIHDMFSGINYTFSDSYKIGDVVEINGYKGKVIEFTIFKTIIQLVDGSYKIYSNGSIKELTNFSKNYVTVNVLVETRELNRVDEIKKIIESTLFVVSQTVEGIVEGPNLVGLNDLSNGVASLKISAKAKIEDYNKVMKGLQEYVLDLILKHDIK